MTKTVDGRSARAIRTRLAIVDALIALVREGNLQPRAIQIAERADVSERLIYHHFGDLETLFRQAAKNTVNELIETATLIDPALPFEARLKAFVTERARVLEYLLPMWRASRVMSAMASGLRNSRDGLQSRSEKQILRVFATELALVPPAMATTAVQTLHGVTSEGPWEVWRVSGLSTEDSKTTMGFAVESILDRLIAAGTAS